MKFLSVLFFAAALTTTAHASYLESCEFTAQVVAAGEVGMVDGQSHPDTKEIVVVVKIATAKDLGSHHPDACESYVNGLQLLKLEPKVLETMEIGSELRLNYFYVSGRGMSSNTKWTLLQ